MKDGDRWVLDELAGLAFPPYAEVLPKIGATFESLRTVEASFQEAVGNILTKRQAVALGLLARTYQLSVACLVSQLHQNHSGWNCACRSLIETFFVVDWVLQDAQRLEAYFENHAPRIGRIKAECCTRYPVFAPLYDRISQVTHVETPALLLSPA